MQQPPSKLSRLELVRLDLVVHIVVTGSLPVLVLLHERFLLLVQFRADKGAEGL